jgi:hypothetical protein
MIPEVKAKFLEALRSGKYKQTCNKLHHGNRYCATGVLCDVVDPTGWNGPDRTGRWRYGNYDYIPSQRVLNLAGITELQLRDLLSLNDELQKTFPEIADWVEDNL